MQALLQDSPTLIHHIVEALDNPGQGECMFPEGISGSSSTSAVLLPLARHRNHKRLSGEPCIIFNKRSRKVKQPGDLCFPGGGISPRLDSCLSNLLNLPLFPLSRWSRWSRWKEQYPGEARRLALLLAACLRESFEEMRLIPLGVKFLGPLPSQRLVLFRRVIYPMVGWIAHQKRFLPNWEVERVVSIPLRNLLNPDYYARYRVRMNTGKKSRQDEIVKEFPCFLHQNGHENEMLWGATYRITMVFLERVFGFNPPDAASLRVVHGSLDQSYFSGAG